MCITERLFVSSLVAFVTKDQRRKLFVYHFKKGTEICSYTYNDSILAVKLNRLVSVGDLTVLVLYTCTG